MQYINYESLTNTNTQINCGAHKAYSSHGRLAWRVEKTVLMVGGDLVSEIFLGTYAHECTWAQPSSIRLLRVAGTVTAADQFLSFPPLQTKGSTSTKNTLPPLLDRVLTTKKRKRKLSLQTTFKCYSQFPPSFPNNRNLIPSPIFFPADLPSLLTDKS